jgi:hypothetical protein
MGPGRTTAIIAAKDASAAPTASRVRPRTVYPRRYQMLLKPGDYARLPCSGQTAWWEWVAHPWMAGVISASSFP